MNDPVGQCLYRVQFSPSTSALSGDQASSGIISGVVKTNACRSQVRIKLTNVQPTRALYQKAEQ